MSETPAVPPPDNDTSPGGSLERAARVLAFYLPQFHPVPENDRWWGPGFTEWTNVAKARPLFRGHVQPNIPADLGFYDLRLPDTRTAQAELAHRYGIEAFCYWHYWFAGRRMLDLPFREVLARGEPQLPFCLAWANHDWAAFWVGEPNRILIEQTYPGRHDYERHFYELLPAFGDPRYVRVDGKPLFFVFRPGSLPDAAAFAEQWRELAAKSGLPGLYLVGECKGAWRAADTGFDAEVYPSLYETWRKPVLPGRIGYHVDLLLRRGPRRYPYAKLAARPRERSRLPYPDLPLVVSNWDNTPRLGRRGLVLTGATPTLFESSMRRAVEAVQDLPEQQRIVFVKSWNEWAEGNYLEPDCRTGHAYLRAIQSAVQVPGDEAAHSAVHRDHLLLGP